MFLIMENQKFYMRDDRLSIWSRELGYKNIQDFIEKHNKEDMFKMYCYSKMYCK